VTWFTDSNVEALYDLEHMIEALAIKAEFPSGDVLLTTWPAGLTLGSDTFLSAPGLSNIVQVEEAEETAQRIFEPRVYSISGVDLSVIPESEIDDSYGSAWTEYLIGINPDTYQVVGYEESWAGYIGRMRRLDSLTPVIQVHVNHRLAALDQADGYRRTHEHQQQFFSGDRGYKKVKGLGAEEIIWGGHRVIPGGVMSGGGGGGGAGGTRGSGRRSRD
jgi:hypothetical protein